MSTTFDDYPEFPDFLKRKPPATPTKVSSVMKPDDIDPAVEADADTPPAKPKAKRTKKAKVAKAKGKSKKAVAKAGKKAKGKLKEKRNRDPAKLDQFGFRKDSIKSRAAALYASKKGASLAEVKAEVGSVQFNILSQLEGEGYEITKSEFKNERGRTATRYKLSQKK